jgi:hypothetical protein
VEAQTPEATMQVRERGRPIRRGSVTLGLILIVVAFLWLLYNLGYLPSDIWYSLWRFWPLILILLGVDVALRGFPAWFALPVLLLATAAIVAIVLMVAPALPVARTVTENLSQELAGSSQAQIQLEVDRGALNVQRMTDEPGLLMKGSFIHDSNILIEQEFNASSGQGRLRVADRYDVLFPSFLFLADIRNDWQVKLTPVIPLAIEVNADNCQLDLDLDGLSLDTFNAELDHSRAEVTLPARDGFGATLDIEDSELVLTVPPDAGARVELQSDDTELALDSSRFTKTSDNEYLSAGYDQAETRLDVVLTAADSSVTIE